MYILSIMQLLCDLLLCCCFVTDETDDDVFRVVRELAEEFELFGDVKL